MSTHALFTEQQCGPWTLRSAWHGRTNEIRVPSEGRFLLHALQLSILVDPLQAVLDLARFQFGPFWIILKWIYQGRAEMLRTDPLNQDSSVVQ